MGKLPLISENKIKEDGDVIPFSFSICERFKGREINIFRIHPFVRYVDYFKGYLDRVCLLVIKDESLSSEPNLPADIFWGCVPNS